MNHYVYENWTMRKAVAHRGDCGSCNDGKGMHSADSGLNGKWHGPYKDRGTAMKAARSLRAARHSRMHPLRGMMQTNAGIDTMFDDTRITDPATLAKERASRAGDLY